MSLPAKKITLAKLRTFADDVKKVHPTEDTEINQISASATSSAATSRTARAAVALPKVAHIPPKKTPVIEKAANVPKIPLRPSSSPSVISTPPAFHTLQKKPPQPIAIPKKSTQDISIEASNSDFGETTIIRDTVKRRTNIFAAFGMSIAESFQKIKKFWKRANQPLYVIPEADRRKGVIQQATSQTGKNFTSDYEKLKTRLRLKVEANEVSTDLKKESDTDITWTPQTETGYHLLPSREIPQTSSVVFESKRSFATYQPVVQPKPPVTQAPIIIPAKSIQTAEPVISEYKENSTPASPAPTFTAKPISEPQIPATRPTPVPIPIQPKPIVIPPTTTPAVAPTPVIIEPSVPPKEVYSKSISNQPQQVTRSWSITNQNTNTITIGIAGALVIVILISIGVSTFVSVLSTPTEIVVSAPVINSITTAPLQTVTYTITESEPLASKISTILLSGVTETELVVLQADGNPWQANQVLAALNLSVSTSFQAAVETVRFVRTGPDTFGIVFTFTNPTQIRGSLLAWEARMANDLTPLLTNLTPNGTFVDRYENGIDLRTLQSGTTVGLSYGFAAENIGIITSSPAAFNTIVDVLVN